MVVMARPTDVHDWTAVETVEDFAANVECLLVDWKADQARTPPSLVVVERDDHNRLVPGTRVITISS
jgi:hypothetical protein